MSRESELKLHNVSNNNEECPKKDCTGILNQLWVRQILTKQLASDRAYAKRHSLEIALGPKVLAAKIADRSNVETRVA